MIDAAHAERFAHEWVAAWNAHDLDAICAHYADDVEFWSPIAARLVPESGGVLHGKAALRAYFAKGLAAFPDLRFELARVLTGVASVTLYYRSIEQRFVAETMELDAHGRVTRALCHYASGGS